MTCLIEIESLEGELMPNGLFHDVDLEVVIRTNTDTGMRFEMVRTSDPISYFLYLDPNTFLYQIRQGYLWTMTSLYKGCVKTFHINIPCSNEVFTVDQLNRQFA